MEDQNNVYSVFEGAWVQCRDVEIRDGLVHCILATERPYKLIEAYSRNPHLKFIRCTDDEKLVVFLRSWGPLRLTPIELANGRSVRPIEEYRSYHRWLSAFVRLLGAFRSSCDERQHLQEFIDAQSEKPLYMRSEEHTS